MYIVGQIWIPCAIGHLWGSTLPRGAVRDSLLCGAFNNFRRDSTPVTLPMIPQRVASLLRNPARPIREFIQFDPFPSVPNVFSIRAVIICRPRVENSSPLWRRSSWFRFVLAIFVARGGRVRLFRRFRRRASFIRKTTADRHRGGISGRTTGFVRWRDMRLDLIAWGLPDAASVRAGRRVVLNVHDFRSAAPSACRPFGGSAIEENADVLRAHYSAGLGLGHFFLRQFHRHRPNTDCRDGDRSEPDIEGVVRRTGHRSGDVAKGSAQESLGL